MYKDDPTEKEEEQEGGERSKGFSGEPSLTMAWRNLRRGALVNITGEIIGQAREQSNSDDDPRLSVSLIYAARKWTNGSMETQQSPPAIYSLGVTILVLGNASGIASNKCPSNFQEVQAALESALQDRGFEFVARMLCQDPMERPSAQELYLARWPNESGAREMTPMLTDQHMDG
jgi:hypothetical protein